MSGSTGGSIATTIDLGEFFAMDACEILYWIAFEMAKDSGEKVVISEWVSRV